MIPKWVFEKDAYHDQNVEQMIERCKANSIPYNYVDFVLFDSSDHIDWKFGDDELVIVYGSIGFCRHVNRTRKYYPGAWLDFDKLRCSSYLAHWGQFSVQQDYAMMPLNEVRRLKDKLFSRYQDENGHIFIRPDTNDKIFHGEKVHLSQFDNWWRIAQIYQPTPEQLTMVSRPSKIEMEWRFVIADNIPITGSRYTRTDNGNVAYSSYNGLDAADLGAQCLAIEIASQDWVPATIYTLDICKTPEGYRLLECGSVNCSGYYKCDLVAIMEAAEKVAQREWSDLNNV